MLPPTVVGSMRVSTRCVNVDECVSLLGGFQKKRDGATHVIFFLCGRPQSLYTTTMRGAGPLAYSTGNPAEPLENLRTLMEDAVMMMSNRASCVW